jgi:hypothetical protein
MALAGTMAIVAPADAASGGIATAIPYTPVKSTVKAPANVTYTDRTYQIVFSGPEADQVRLYYSIGGTDRTIQWITGSVSPYNWNPPDTPDPTKPTQTVFHKATIKAVWMKRATDGTYYPISTAYSPEFTLARPGAFVIATQALPPAYVGTAYSVNLAAEGGETPYYWHIASGSLPSWLNLSSNGRLRGTPTGTGSWTARFRVTDAGVDSLHDEIDLTVNAVAPGSATPAPQPFDFYIRDLFGPFTITRPSEGYETLSMTVRVVLESGTPRTVTMSSAGNPSGMDVTFSPRSFLLAGGVNTAMNITLNNDVTPGIYDLVIRAAAEGGVERTTGLRLNVTVAGTTGDLRLVQCYDLGDGYSEKYIMPVQVNDYARYVIKGKNTVFKATIASTFDSDRDVYVELWLATADWSWADQPHASGMSLLAASGRFDFPEHYVYSATVTVPAHGEIEVMLPDPAGLATRTIHSSPHGYLDELTIVSNAPRPAHSGGEYYFDEPEYTFVIDPYDRITEDDERNNCPPTVIERIESYDSASLNVFWMPVISDEYGIGDFWPGGVSGTAFSQEFTNNVTPQARNTMEFMNGVYPVADEGKLSYFISQGVLTVEARGSSDDGEQVHIQEYMADMAAENGYDRFVGLVPAYGWYGDLDDWWGVVWNSNPRACFVRINAGDYCCAVHECFHNLGHPDVYNGLVAADDGYWVNHLQDIDVSADDVRDYMEHAGWPNYWTKEARYNIVRNDLPASEDPPVLLFRCLLGKDGSVDLKPFMIVDGRADAEPEAWTHRIMLKDAGGALVREHKVNVAFFKETMNIQGKGQFPAEEAFISALVLWSEDVALVELRDGAGSLIASRAVSRSAPVIDITEPAPGTAWAYGGEYPIRWTASDPDGDALNYSLAMSPDRLSWIPVAIDVGSTSYTFDTSSVGPGHYYFRVRATDGVRSALDTMEYSVEVKPGDGTAATVSPSATGPGSAAQASGTPAPVQSAGGGQSGINLVLVAVAAVGIVGALIAIFLLLVRKK